MSENITSTSVDLIPPGKERIAAMGFGYNGETDIVYDVEPIIANVRDTAGFDTSTAPVAIVVESPVRSEGSTAGLEQTLTAKIAQIADLRRQLELAEDPTDRAKLRGQIGAREILVDILMKKLVSTNRTFVEASTATNEITLELPTVPAEIAVLPTPETATDAVEPEMKPSKLYEQIRMTRLERIKQRLSAMFRRKRESISETVSVEETVSGNTDRVAEPVQAEENLTDRTFNGYADLIGKVYPGTDIDDFDKSYSYERYAPARRKASKVYAVILGMGLLAIGARAISDGVDRQESDETAESTTNTQGQQTVTVQATFRDQNHLITIPGFDISFGVSGTQQFAGKEAVETGMQKIGQAAITETPAPENQDSKTLEINDISDFGPEVAAANSEALATKSRGLYPVEILSILSKEPQHTVMQKIRVAVTSENEAAKLEKKEPALMLLEGKTADQVQIAASSGQNMVFDSVVVVDELLKHYPNSLN